MGGIYTTHGTGEKYKNFVENIPQKRQFGRPRYKWEDNIKVDLTEI